jgi:hypothetical protein
MRIYQRPDPKGDHVYLARFAEHIIAVGFDAESDTVTEIHVITAEQFAQGYGGLAYVTETQSKG